MSGHECAMGEPWWAQPIIDGGDVSDQVQLFVEEPGTSLLTRFIGHGPLPCRSGPTKINKKNLKLIFFGVNFFKTCKNFDFRVIIGRKIIKN